MKLSLLFFAVLTGFLSTAVDAAAITDLESRATCGTPTSDTLARLRRSYNPTLTDHFLTWDGIVEAQYWGMGYLSDGDTTTNAVLSTAGQLFTAQQPGTVALFRLYNSATSTHLFTANAQVLSSALASGYAYEGLPYRHIVGYVYITGDCPGTVPLYWAQSSSLTDNYYTIFPAKYNTFVAQGYQGMGVAAWIYPLP